MKKQPKNTTSNKVWIVGMLIVILGLSLWSYHHAKRVVTVLNNPELLPGIQTGNAPWEAETTNLRARLNAVHLPALSSEGSALHLHQHLDIFVNGKLIPVPSGIGVNQSVGFISDIHTHDNTGVIHVESPRIQTFTLGQFFDIWGVQFTEKSIGGYIAVEDNLIKVFVNGKQYTGDPRQLPLETHQEIVITYGTEKESPSIIPSSYQFTAGL
jgi:hypothetical protein